MTPLFVATERFDPLTCPTNWQTYISGSGLLHLREVVSLDTLLCPRLLQDTKAEYWPYIVNEDFMGQFFTNLEFLRAEVAGVFSKNILGVYREPTATPSPPDSGKWDFIGYDLVDVTCGISALTNCGGFPQAFDETELSSQGLLIGLVRAREVQQNLKKQYPEEPHADCDIWAIFRSAA